MQAIYEQLLILLSTPLYVIIIVAEVLLSNYHHRKLYSWKDSVVNVYLMLLNSLIDVFFRGFYIGLLTYCYQHRYVEWHQAILYWGLLLLAEDFLYYWLHRFDHEIRLFWAVHVDIEIIYIVVRILRRPRKVFNFSIIFQIEEASEFYLAPIMTKAKSNSHLVIKVVLGFQNVLHSSAIS